MLLALIVPFAGTAVAAVRADNTCDLQVTPEQDSNATGTPHTLTANITNCTSGDTAIVAFEFEAGPSARVNCVVGVGDNTCTGGTAVSSTDTPPADTSCTTGTLVAGAGSCSIVFTSDTGGTHTIRGWVDDDEDLGTEDADTSEGPDADDTGNEIAEVPNAADQPGTRPEVDDTDVVQKTWFGAAPGNPTLDCGPEAATNPTTGADSTEVYTCTAFSDANNNNTLDGSDPRINGVNIDGENLSGAPNDPDGGNLTPADYNNCGTTDGNGTATCSVSATEQQAGTANICFWLDFDNDAASASVTDPNDGSECGEGVGAAAEDTDDQTDVVAKTWQAVGVAALIDCSPEADQNVIGTQHTVTCVVTDFFGTPVQGAAVDFSVSGRNTPVAQDNQISNAQGVATFTYTDSGLTLSQEGQADTIEGCLDPDNVAGCGPGGGAHGVDEGDASDVVSKFWFTTLPTTASLELDMEDNTPADFTDNDCVAPYEAAATDNAVNTLHEICAEARNAAGTGIPGQQITFTLSGPGTFVDTKGTAATTDDVDTNAKTISVGADQNGDASVVFRSRDTGTTTVTATSGSATDTGTKAWVSATPTARIVDCLPATGTNEPGTTHTVLCTVTDRFGNPVSGVDLAVTETGPGRISSATPAAPTGATTGSNVRTDAEGEVQVILTTTVDEEGTQTLRAEILGGAGPFVRTAGANNDACEMGEGRISAEEGGAADNVAGTPAPAGVCVDTATKTWTEDVEPAPECDDDIDNDGDGLIDFPNDPGCESALDDSESDVPVECTGEGIIAGTDGADVLTGTAGDDVICGFGGNDTLNGLGGDDVLLGGGGDDDINGGDGADTIEGDAVAACLQTGCADGRDTLDGGGAKDTIRGHGGNDLLLGGNKNDLMVGNAGNDTLRGQAGWDTIRGNAGDDRMIGNAGNDILQGGTGNDLAKGGSGDDTIRGFVGRDNLRGGGGNDIIKGAGGRDQLRGGRGDDILDGGAGRDACFGGPGNDTLRRCE